MTGRVYIHVIYSLILRNIYLSHTQIKFSAFRNAVCFYFILSKIILLAISLLNQQVLVNYIKNLGFRLSEAMPLSRCED
jgi:hypothetical protein